MHRNKVPVNLPPCVVLFCEPTNFGECLKYYQQDVPVCIADHWHHYPWRYCTTTSSSSSQLLLARVEFRPFMPVPVCNRVPKMSVYCNVNYCTYGTVQLILGCWHPGSCSIPNVLIFKTPAYYSPATALTTMMTGVSQYRNFRTWVSSNLYTATWRTKWVAACTWMSFVTPYHLSQECQNELI